MSMDSQETNKRSNAFVATSNHWTKVKRRKDDEVENQSYVGSTKERPIEIEDSPAAQEVIELKSEEGENNTSEKHGDETILKRSAIRLMHNPSYSLDDAHADLEVNKDTVTLTDLIGSEDLKETYQFNFSVDLEFFLMHMHLKFSKMNKKITFITGSILLDAQNSDQDLAFIKSKFNIHEVVADLPIRFGTHHTKMMINFYENDTCEIVIMTCNLQKIDFGGLTQMCWRSGRLKRTNKPTISKRGARFQKDLKNYLLRYKKKSLQELSRLLNDYDFLSICVELVASTPGYFNMEDMTQESEIYGYGKFYQVLKRNNLLIDNSHGHKKFNILAQVSSISYPFALNKQKTSSVFSHLLCPLIFAGQNKVAFDLLEPGAHLFKEHQTNHNYQPYIVYPSAEDVARSNVGFTSGQAIHFKYLTSATHRNQYEQNIKPYLYKWRSDPADETGRQNVPPHVKLYICDNGDNWSTFRWVLMGSHNLSKQAWGGKQELKFTNNDPRKFKVASYELGVLIPGSPKPQEETKQECATDLAPVYGSDSFLKGNKKTPVRMPFKLPPMKYDVTDQPWCAQLNYGSKLKDRFGQSYHGLDF